MEIKKFQSIRLHLEPFFGPSLLTEITREGLCRYVNKRIGETLIRCKKASKEFVHRGTVSNELSVCRRMLRVAMREGYKLIRPSFEDLIVRTKFGGRAFERRRSQESSSGLPDVACQAGRVRKGNLFEPRRPSALDG